MALDLETRARLERLYGKQGSQTEHGHMEIGAVQFLLWQKKCVLFAKERGGVMGNPDILGIGKDRTIYEIEIKCSVADFRRNKEKSMQKFLAQHPELGRHFFYYMVSPFIAEKVIFEVEPKFGLMTLDGKSQTGITVLRRAGRLHTAKPPVKKIIEFVRDQSGTMLNLLAKNHQLRSKDKI